MEVFALVLLVAVSPLVVLGTLMPANEHTWMAGDDGQTPPDCDMVTDVLVVAPAIVVVLAGATLAVWQWRRRTRLGGAALVLAAVLLLLLASAAPEHVREARRASAFCS